MLIEELHQPISVSVLNSFVKLGTATATIVRSRPRSNRQINMDERLSHNLIPTGYVLICEVDRGSSISNCSVGRPDMMTGSASDELDTLLTVSAEPLRFVVSAMMDICRIVATRKCLLSYLQFKAD